MRDEWAKAPRGRWPTAAGESPAPAVPGRGERVTNDGSTIREGPSGPGRRLHRRKLARQRSSPRQRVVSYENFPRPGSLLEGASTNTRATTLSAAPDTTPKLADADSGLRLRLPTWPPTPTSASARAPAQDLEKNDRNDSKWLEACAAKGSPAWSARSTGSIYGEAEVSPSRRTNVHSADLALRRSKLACEGTDPGLRPRGSDSRGGFPFVSILGERYPPPGKLLDF